MGDHIHIEGVPPYDGDYPIDAADMTNRDLHLIKKISGVRAGELEEAFVNADNDLVVAFAAVALEHAGMKVVEEVLWDAPVGAIKLVLEEDTESPPGPPPTELGGLKNADEKRPSSGVSSRNDGVPLQNDQSPTGSPHSVTGVISAPVTSVI